MFKMSGQILKLHAITGIKIFLYTHSPHDACRSIGYSSQAICGK